MASSPVTSWKIDWEKMETVADLIFLVSKIPVDGDCSYEIRRHLLLGRNIMTNLSQTVKRLPTLRETWVQSLGREDSLEKEMATHSSILAWRIPRTEEPGGVASGTRPRD